MPARCVTGGRAGARHGAAYSSLIVVFVHRWLFRCVVYVTCILNTNDFLCTRFSMVVLD